MVYGYPFKNLNIFHKEKDKFMKLLKCYIQNFGKLNNLNYDFNDGINIIKQDNGFGKTTFAIFIKSMFYGLDNQANARIEKSDRKKYIPWQGGIYGGNVEFEINNKKYRIERTFGKKASEDTFKLYDLSTNLESNDYTENIGEELFKINKSGYERSTYIPQGQIKIEMEDSISAKLGNVLEGEKDINTSEEALKRLNEEKKIYKKDRGQGGLIDDKKNRLFELQRKFENSKLDIENLEIRKKQVDSKIKEITEIEENKNKLQKILSKKIEQDRLKAKKENYDLIVNNFNSYKNEYNKLSDFFAKGVPTEEFIENLTNMSYEFEKTKIDNNNLKISEQEQTELSALENKFKNISIDDINNKILDFSQIQEIENNIEEKKKQKEKAEIEKETLYKKHKKNFLVMIISIILILLGISFIVLNIQKIVGISLVCIGIILGIISLFCKKQKHKIMILKKQIISIQKEIELLNGKIDNINNEVEQFIKNFNTQEDINIMFEFTNLKSEYRRYEELKKNKITKEIAFKNSKIKLEELKEKIEQNLAEYFSDLDRNYIDLIQELKININQFKNVEVQLHQITNEKENFEKQNNIDELNNIKELNINEDETKLQIEKYNKQIEVLVDEKNQIKNYIEVLENKIDESEYLENEIQSTKDEIKNLEEKYKILKITEELLKSSKESFSSRYLKDMVAGFNKYLNFIDKNELKTLIDTNLNVRIDVNGSQKEIKTFSEGYKDLIYICMRLSLIDTLYKEEKPFVVLDDPFTNLDDSKTKKSLKIIKEFAKQYQIIYFTCNESRI